MDAVINAQIIMRMYANHIIIAMIMWTHGSAT